MVTRTPLPSPCGSLNGGGHFMGLPTMLPRSFWPPLWWGIHGGHLCTLAPLPCLRVQLASPRGPCIPWPGWDGRRGGPIPQATFCLPLGSTVL